MGSTRTHTPPAVMRQTGVPLRVEKRPVKLVYFERGALGE
jgi:hypothetical protein